MHVCTCHLEANRKARLDQLSLQVSLHFLDWQWQPSTVFHLDRSFIPFKFICNVSLSHTLSLCSSCLQSGVWMLKTITIEKSQGHVQESSDNGSSIYLLSYYTPIYFQMIFGFCEHRCTIVCTHTYQLSLFISSKIILHKHES